MQVSSKEAVLRFLQGRRFMTLLDAPTGGGWLRRALEGPVVMDGIDLYAERPAGYRHFWRHDLDNGLPAECGKYDVICCCEGIEHVGNPLALLRGFWAALVPGGLAVVTTPNVWFPQARLQYLWRGFFPSFPQLVGKIRPGSHMHVMPWSYPQLYVFASLAGFSGISLVAEELSKPKHLHERWLGCLSKLYYRRKLAAAATPEEKAFWQVCQSEEALLGRHLIAVFAKN